MEGIAKLQYKKDDTPNTLITHYTHRSSSYRIPQRIVKTINTQQILT